MNSKRLLFSALVMLMGLQGLLGQSEFFVQDADSTNIVSNWTSISNAQLNGDPNAIVIVTPNWNPSLSTGIYNSSPIGVWYDFDNLWSIFNQKTDSMMPTGASFNVMIPGSEVQSYVHTASASNIVGNWTVLDHPDLNGNPDAIAFFTPNWNPGDITGVYNDFNTGLWYEGNNWAIYNEDLSPMTEGASFNIVIPGSSSYLTEVHTADSTNIVSNWTVLDNPFLNGNPDAIFMMSPVWNPAGSSGVYNDHATGVWYDGSRWAVFNQDLSPMTEGASFNIMLDVTVDIKDAQGSLSQATLSPQPMRGLATLKLYNDAPQNLVLTLYTLDGKKLTQLAEGTYPVGNISIPIALQDYPAGVYFYQLQGESGQVSGKLQVY